MYRRSCFIYWSTGELIVAIERGQQRGADNMRVRSVEYIQLMCDAISVSISALFYETLSQVEFWISFNRVYTLYANMCHMVDGNNLVVTFGRYFRETVLRSLDESTNGAQSINIEFAMTTTSAMHEINLESSVHDLLLSLDDVQSN